MNLLRASGLISILALTSCTGTFSKSPSYIGERTPFHLSECFEHGLDCDRQAFTPTSIVGLLGNPDQFSEIAVTVEGFVAYDIHGSWLFISSEHCKNFMSEYAIKLGGGDIEGFGEFIYSLRHCSPIQVSGRYFPTKERTPEPNVLVYRDSPGVMIVTYAEEW